jgi:hypothetical protein
LGHFLATLDNHVRQLLTLDKHVRRLIKRAPFISTKKSEDSSNSSLQREAIDNKKIRHFSQKPINNWRK